jgi:hypothetical protein
MDGAHPIATHNVFNRNDPGEIPGQVAGPIVLLSGTTRTDIEAWFVDTDSILPGPDRPRARLDIPTGSLHSLAWTVADGAIVDLVANATGKWYFDIVAKAPGKTTATFQFLYDGSVRYTSGAIPIHVTDLTPGDRLDDYTFKKNGVWTVTVDSSVVDSTHCRTANPGWFEVDAGDLTDLYFLNFINACATTSGAGWDIRFEFEHDFIASVLHHPFHWNERDEFHIKGVASGQTTVRLYLMQGGEVRIVSPPILVVVP